MPDRSTVHLWVVEDREGFSRQYANARQAQALRWADEILEIADDGTNDTYETDEGERVDSDVIQRSRLRVDTRKWLLSKVLPKVYGDRTALEVSGPDGKPIELTAVPTDELRAKAAQLAGRVIGQIPASTNGNGSANGTHG